jgi:hypothetical protein
MTSQPISGNPVQDMLDKWAENVAGLQGDALAAYENLEFYSEWCMGYENPEYVGNSRFIRRIYQELQYSTEQNFLILGPRNSAKSTAITITYVSWKLGRNPLLRFLLSFAAKETQGYAFSRQLGQIIEDNQRFIEIFGRLKPERPEKWTDEEKIIKRPTPPGGLKDASITVVGFGSSVPSKRSDETICDDLVTQENAYSERIQNQLEAFVVQTLFPISIPGGRRIIVGSRWDANDLYNRMAVRWGLDLPKPIEDDISSLRELAAS